MLRNINIVVQVIIIIVIANIFGKHKIIFHQICIHFLSFRIPHKQDAPFILESVQPVLAIRPFVIKIAF